MRFQRRQLLRTLSFAFGSSFIWSRNQLGLAVHTAIQPMVSPPRAVAPVRESPWLLEAGPTAFAPFKETSGHFEDARKVWMLNFRVRDLDKMAAQLQAAGIEVKIDPQSYLNGRFARVYDPEGNPIELWQPKVPATNG